MKKILLIVALAGTLTAAACGDDDGAGDNNNNNIQPTVNVVIVDPADQEAITGTVVVQVSVDGDADQLVLMVDGQAAETVPVTGPSADIYWNTERVDDGTHELVVAAGRGGAMVAQSESIEVVTDNTAPVIQVTNLERPYIYSGTVDHAVDLIDPHAAGAVVLKINGVEVDTSESAPHVLSWDSTAHQDGPVEVTIEATDALGNAGVLNLTGTIINDGQVVTYSDGDGNGTFFVPTNYTPGMEVDHKYHWTMPDNISSMMGVLQWEDPGWSFRLALGTGICPHSGVTLASMDGDSGQIVVTHDASPTYDTVDFFTHLGAAPSFDLTDMLGEGTAYWMVVALY